MIYFLVCLSSIGESNEVKNSIERKEFRPITVTYYMTGKESALFEDIEVIKYSFKFGIPFDVNSFCEQKYGCRLSNKSITLLVDKKDEDKFNSKTILCKTNFDIFYNNAIDKMLVNIDIPYLNKYDINSNSINIQESTPLDRVVSSLMVNGINYTFYGIKEFDKFVQSDS
jgi:hypothetical protein